MTERDRTYVFVISRAVTKGVEDLDVFKMAHELALKTCSVSKRFPKEETFSLVDQMRRAAVSVGMNLVRLRNLFLLAEGSV